MDVTTVGKHRMPFQALSIRFGADPEPEKTCPAPSFIMTAEDRTAQFSMPSSQRPDRRSFKTEISILKTCKIPNEGLLFYGQ